MHVYQYVLCNACPGLGINPCMCINIFEWHPRPKKGCFKKMPKCASLGFKSKVLAHELKPKPQMVFTP